jgi:hypothetical protein
MERTISTFNWLFLTPQHLSQQLKLNAQLGGHHIIPIHHVDEITYASQRWKSITLGYYIPRTIILS